MLKRLAHRPGSHWQFHPVRLCDAENDLAAAVERCDVIRRQGCHHVISGKQLGPGVKSSFRERERGRHVRAKRTEEAEDWTHVSAFTCIVRGPALID